jgi:predicted TIM-barrel fold metal-dependent hydrolase
MTTATDWMISVDDHVIEPPTVWTDRLPSKYHDVGPRMVDHPDGELWLYEDKQVPTVAMSVAAGRSNDFISPKPVHYKDMREGAYDPIHRLADMDRAGILASLCFPSFPRFCGQVFHEAKDKRLALLCVKAYNDWMIDEWCAAGPGRYIPMIIVPLWDPRAAAEEMERGAAKGARAFAFSENPEPLGLPTIHDPGRYWDPVMAAAQDNELIVCMHVGSSSTLPKISSNSPQLADLTWGAMRTSGTMLSWLFSDYFERMPGLKICLSEGNIGWMPYFVERAEQVVDKQKYWASAADVKLYSGDSGVGEAQPTPQADLFRLDVRRSVHDHVFGCFIEETVGLRCLDIIGEDNVMMEVDYPHSDTNWPNSIKVARDLVAGLTEAQQYKVLRGNAERLFRFTAAEVDRSVQDA